MSSAVGVPLILNSDGPNFDSRRLARSIAENPVPGTAVGSPVTADSPGGDPLTYMLSGPGLNFFTIDLSTGQIRVRSGAALDHERKRCRSVTVTASDSSLAQEAVIVTIMVEDQNDHGTVTLSTAEPQVGESLTATLTDDDGVANADWLWERSLNGVGNWTPIDNASRSYYTPTAADKGHYLRAAVTYTDNYSSAATAQAATDTPVREPPPPPPPPKNRGGGGGGGGGGGFDDGGGDELPAKASDLFEDIDAGVWYESAVSWMILHDVTSGCAPTLFCPDANLTRQQFVTFLWRAAGRPTPTYQGSEAFTDVEEGVYSDQAIGWAVSNEITVGCTPGAFSDPDWKFCPTDHVTRGQIATLLYRHVQADYIGKVPSHTDIVLDEYYAVSVSWLTDFQVVPGCGPTLFCPNRKATRAEAALFINGVAIRPHIWGEGNTSFIPQPQ